MPEAALKTEETMPVSKAAEDTSPNLELVSPVVEKESPSYLFFAWEQKGGGLVCSDKVLRGEFMDAEANFAASLDIRTVRDIASGKTKHAISQEAAEEALVEYHLQQS